MNEYVPVVLDTIPMTQQKIVQIINVVLVIANIFVCSHLNTLPVECTPMPQAFSYGSLS